jgi:hypothetical protein
VKSEEQKGAGLSLFQFPVFTLHFSLFTFHFSFGAPSRTVVFARADKTPGIPAMTVREDPAVRTARREACASLAVWLAAMSYTLAYCYFFGYQRDPAALKLIWGVPDWVLYGVVAPWTACTIVSGIFAFAFVADVDLGEELDESADFSHQAAPSPEAGHE